MMWEVEFLGFSGFSNGRGIGREKGPG